jgi:hypothetical protein
MSGRVDPEPIPGARELDRESGRERPWRLAKCANGVTQPALGCMTVRQQVPDRVPEGSRPRARRAPGGLSEAAPLQARRPL